MLWYQNWLHVVFYVVKFCLTIFLAIVVYQALFATILTKEIHIVTYILFWFFSAYVVLPRLNRLLARFYVPDYFIGRAKTSDGLLGDPINLAFYGSEEDLLVAFEKAGWHQADPLTLQSSIKIVTSSVFGKSYEKAPVSSLYLFGAQQQDLAFEREIDGNPRKRHHVRLWKTPEDWHLPGGKQADWIGGATFDKNIGLSLFTGQITHKIDANVDKERDFLIETLQTSGCIKDIYLAEHFTTSYHSRNGGGDRIHTDGALPFITIQSHQIMKGESE